MDPDRTPSRCCIVVFKWTPVVVTARACRAYDLGGPPTQ